MKIKALSRSVEAYQPPGSKVPKAPRNLDPAIHPFERAREYTRALNAVKLERMFAQPFIAQLGKGHVDGVYSMATDSNSLERLASGSGDGVIKVWDLTSREQIWHGTAHENIVKSVCWTRDQKLLSASSDKAIKLFDPYNTPCESKPISSWLGASAFTSLSHHRSRNAFAAASSSSIISIYDLERHTAAPETLHWPSATDTITAVAFNQSETSVLASCATDRSVLLYDLRTSTPVAKTVLNFTSNAVAWNPMETFNLATASEDHNAYIFDVRKFDRALNILKDHVAAVMDVQFSPTGEELVTASYDRTIRIWNRDKGHSRDIYHTKRMQRCFQAKWTQDSKYLLTGSDDGNVRLWRANASHREGIKSTKQRQALEYNEALSTRYSHMPEIRRIKRHRHIPTVVKKAGEIKKEELKAIKRREENERRHTKKQFEKRKSERDKVILAKEK
ncbi:putative u3 small nucleolar rna associated protein [Eutypa lata UCREL1]|uniref:DDB1- and CUL4-associated factor 13 n=1 Tax=Eutypa lata (strain UCR-EL1) TaxID=1287681 RepID=M7T1X1_EUTLA|nr:putative u3 small nucleolar rna associated protein [Eutypa lata UCREL1]